MNQGARSKIETSFADLMQAGRTAYASGNRRLAHDNWRQAAKLDPYNEQVWVALLDVIDREEDKIVCLENIVKINPMNVQARRELNAIQARMQFEGEFEEENKAQEIYWGERRRVLLRYAILLGIGLGLAGVFFAIVLSILLYGR